MILLFILLGIFIVVGGGINYVCAILNKKKSTKKQLPGLFIAFFVDSVIMTVINVILLRNLLYFKSRGYESTRKCADKL